jgi:bifunctional DNA-binding transcriptional regulator/antitoxin component of YhaV-PrlF toxin-antitoxin module
VKKSIKKFKAKLGSDEGSLFIEVPFDVTRVFGKARPAVKVTVNRHQYRSTIAVYNDRSYVGVRKSNREAAGVEIGEVVNVTIEIDDVPRVVLMPAELAEALARSAAAQAAWRKLSYSHQREHAEAITGAKKAETRAKRVKKTVKLLLEKSARKAEATG